MKICSTCGVEHDDAAALCRICADERQWIPTDGQHWTTLDELVGAGHSIAVRELEPDLFGLTVEPSFAIGQRSHLIRTPAGVVLWDLVGYVDDAVVRRIREIGEVVAIVPSHPHHFGVQVEWSRALGGVPVMVAEADLEWVARPDPVIRTWSGKLDVLPGVTVRQVGGHFPGSAVLHWAAGAGGAGALFSADTIHGNPDHSSVTFMRSYPNRIPLSAAVVQRITASVEEFEFDRLYDNVGKIIGPNAREIIRRSADRYTGWVRGDFDHLT